MDKWKEYEHLTSLYKFYLTIIVSVGVFSFTTVGGITSYVLNTINDINYLKKYVILLPLIFSMGLTYIYWRSIKPAQELKSALERIGKKELNVELVPHAYLLVHAIVLFFLLYLLIDLGLLVLIFNYII